MHCLDALVVSSRERIRCENILWVVVVKLQRDLHIKLFVLADSNKVDLAAAGFANMDSVPSAAKLQVHDILKAGCHTVSIYSQERPHKIELFLRFQKPLALQIKARTTVKQISLLQLFQVTVDCFVVQRPVFRFQVIRDGFCREGIPQFLLKINLFCGYKPQNFLIYYLIADCLSRFGDHQLVDFFI